MYTDSYNDGTGIVEFSRYEDFRRALRDMDDSKFRSHEVHYRSTHNFDSVSTGNPLQGETAYIRVKDPNRSRSPSPYRNRSKSRSRSRSRSRSY